MLDVPLKQKVSNCSEKVRLALKHEALAGGRFRARPCLIQSRCLDEAYTGTRVPQNQGR